VVVIGGAAQQRGGTSTSRQCHSRHLNLTHLVQVQEHGRQPAAQQDPRMQELHVEGKLVGRGQRGGGGGGGGGSGGGARPVLTLFTFSPVFFFSCVIKSGVSVGGARVGRGARRGVSRW